MNIIFEIGKVEEVILVWYKVGIVVDVLVVDLLWKGCDEKLLEIILVMKLKKVVYVFCNLGILVCDMKILMDGGYVVKKV